MRAIHASVCVAPDRGALSHGDHGPITIFRKYNGFTLGYSHLASVMRAVSLPVQMSSSMKPVLFVRLQSGTQTAKKCGRNLVKNIIMQC